jgi:hypothetical protein
MYRGAYNSIHQGEFYQEKVLPISLKQILFGIIKQKKIRGDKKKPKNFKILKSNQQRTSIQKAI